MLLFFTLPMAFAQVEDDDNDDDANEQIEDDSEFPQPTTKVAKYFEDGTKTLAKNALKLDLAYLFNGTLNFNYERRLNNSFGIEAQAGFKFISGISTYTYFEPSLIFKKLSPAKSPVIGGQIKYYNNGGAIDFGTYYSLGMYHETMGFPELDGQKKYKINMNYYRLYWGLCYLKGNMSAWDFGYYVGVVTAKVVDNEALEIIPAFMDYGITLKYGIFF